MSQFIIIFVILYCTVLCCAVLVTCAVLCYAVMACAVMSCVVLCSSFCWSPVLCCVQVEEDDLLDLYGKSMACAVLGKIGPQRTRVLLLLQKVRVCVRGDSDQMLLLTN